jgi:hypothetical protein
MWSKSLPFFSKPERLLRSSKESGNGPEGARWNLIHTTYFRKIPVKDISHQLYFPSKLSQA